ncbi:MAG: HIT family protein [Pseudomonadota bacterium]
MTEQNCIFCQIIAGNAPSAKIYEDENVFVFLDIFPASVGHTLVVPKGHYETIYEMSDDAMAHVARAARSMAVAIGAVLEPDGLNVTQANGVAAGQTVPHYHVHLVPRTEGVRTRMHGSERADDDALKALAKRIAEAL